MPLLVKKTEFNHFIHPCSRVRLSIMNANTSVLQRSVKATWWGVTNQNPDFAETFELANA